MFSSSKGGRTFFITFMLGFDWRKQAPHPSQYIFLGSVAVLAGVLLGSFVSRDILGWFFCGLFAFLFFVFFFFGRAWIFFFVFFTTLFLFTATRTVLFFERGALISFDRSFSSGEIIALPEIHIDHIRYTVRRSDGERILVFAHLFPRYQRGDAVVLSSCSAKHSLSSFRFDRFFLSRDINALCFYPDISRVAFHNPSFFARTSDALITFFSARTEQLFHEPYASLFLGMTLGTRSGFTEAETLLFSRTGTSHILAVSGYNVTLLVAVFFSLGIRLGLSRRTTSFLLVFFLVWYAVITGLSASVLRATFFGGIVLLAYALARKVRPLFLLVCIAALLALYRPSFLLYDPGFQLSFLATAVLFSVTAFSKTHARSGPNFWHISENFSTTGFVWIGTLPLILWYFHSISLVAVVVNILLLPLVPITLALGMLGIFFSVLPGFSFIRFLFVFSAHFLFVLFWDILTFFSSWKYASLSLAVVPWYVVVFLFLVLVFFLYFFSSRREYFL